MPCPRQRCGRILIVEGLSPTLRLASLLVAVPFLEGAARWLRESSASSFRADQKTAST